MENLKTLGELCTISIGRTPARANHRFWDPNKKTNNIWLSIADLGRADSNAVISDSSEYLSDVGASTFSAVPAGTLLMSFKLTIGRLAFAGVDLRTNEAIAALIPLDPNEIDTRFLYYMLMSKDWDAIAGSDVKVKGKTLNKQKLGVIPISYPSIEIQRQVVEKLDGLMDEFQGVEALIKLQQASLSELKASILRSGLKAAADGSE
jgi:type I restriction enzyme S subunit